MHLVLPLPGNEVFAGRLAEAGGWELGQLDMRRFPDGESYVRLRNEVADRDVNLVCTLSRPDELFLRLLFTADAARSLGARSITLVAPYLAYMRQDRRFAAGEAVTSRTFARLISSSVDRVVTVDPHLHRYGALSAIYTVATATLHAAPLLADWIASNVPAPLLLGPDEESEQWVAAIASRIGAPHAVLRKVRRGDRSVEVEVPDLRSWRGRQPVLVDDIASSGETLIDAARKLPLQGLPRPVCAVVHPVFADEAYSRLAQVAATIVSTDTISHASNAISVASLIAAALSPESDARDERIRKRGLPEPVDRSDSVLSGAST